MLNFNTSNQTSPNCYLSCRACAPPTSVVLYSKCLLVSFTHKYMSRFFYDSNFLKFNYIYIYLQYLSYVICIIRWSIKYTFIY